MRRHLSKLVTVLRLLGHCAAGCGPAREDRMDGRAALLRAGEGDLAGVEQCTQDGVTKCTAVTADLALIRSLKAGTKLELMAGLGISVEVRRVPLATASGGLSVSLLLADGGEGSLVIGTTGSMYGNIRPLTGSVIYAIEACRGQGCNVLLERPSDYFNKFED